jgi:hypothetical protein
MNLAHTHAWERLWRAVEILATGSEPPRERAWYAYQTQIADLRPEEFCEESRELFLELRRFTQKRLDEARLNPAPRNPERDSPVEIAGHKMHAPTGRKLR